MHTHILIHITHTHILLDAHIHVSKMAQAVCQCLYLSCCKGLSKVMAANQAITIIYIYRPKTPRGTPIVRHGREIPR